MSERAGKYGQGHRLQKVRRGVRAAVFIACSLSLSHAFAQDDSSAEETAAARTLALEGIKLADAGRCEEAIDRLARAERLHHAPVVLGRLGECQVARGRLVEGTETLRKVLREALPANPPEVLLKARERAQSVLDKAKGKIGAVNIIVRGPEESSRVTVTVDGEPMNVALLEVDRPTDPGEHLVEASAPGFLSASSHVTVGPGTRQNVVIELAADPRAPVAEPSADSSAAGLPAQSETGTPLAPQPMSSDASTLQSDAAQRNEADEPNHTAAYVAWAVSGAAVITGSVLGVMALNRKSELEDECPANLCPASSRDSLDSARGIGTAATVSFVVAGATAGLGTILYFTVGSPPDGPEQSTAQRRSSPLARSGSELRARAYVGLGSVGLSGEF
jgi:hypothetical protein